MNFYFSLALLISLTACHSTNQTTGKKSIPFDPRPFESHSFLEGSSKLRNKLLHQVYLSKKNLAGEFENEITNNDYSDLKLSSDYQHNFSTLIVSYKDKEEVFYIPENTKKEEIVNKLKLDTFEGDNWIWKSEIKRGGIVYLIITSPSEVLENEKNFKYSLTDKLETIYPYQRVESSTEVYESNPEIKVISATVKIHGCRNSEAPELCFCNYTRLVPTGNMLNFEKNNSIITNTIIGNSQDQKAIMLKLDLPVEKAFQLNSVPNGCGPHASTQVFPLKKIFQYKTQFKIYGVSELLETFGNLPIQILIEG
jgi:hypothetical protein